MFSAIFTCVTLSYLIWISNLLSIVINIVAPLYWSRRTRLGNPLCDTPRQAKQIAMIISGHLLIHWHQQKCNVMYQIVCAKAKWCAKLKDALIRSDKNIIAEGTVDTFWGLGMPGYYAKNTSPECLCGHNRLGKILMDVRKTLLDELLASSQTPPPVACLNRVISKTPMSNTASVSDVANSSTNAPTNQDNNPRSETPVTASTSGSH